MSESIPRHLGETAVLLRRMAVGDREAGDQLMHLVYDELRRIAERMVRQKPSNHSLHATDLVHAAFARMGGGEGRSYQNRNHFLGVAAKAMRSALVDHVRKKRSRPAGNEGLDAVVASYEERCLDVLAFDDELSWLAKKDEELARLVELRFFGGLTMEEVASVMGVTKRAAERSWETARTLLRKRMRIEPNP